MLKSKPARVLATMGALSALAGTGCLGGSETSPTAQSSDGTAPAVPLTEGGTLTVGLTAEPDYIDPARMQSLDSWQVLLAMCEGLYKIDGRGRSVPQLAIGPPELSDGGRTATIRLRSGVTFNDGTPFDAKAVQASLQRNGETSILFQGTGIEKIEAPSADTVVLRLAKPYGPLQGDLAGPGGMIASPTQLKKLGDDFASKPVCVAPFEFVSRKAGSSIKLKRSARYYDADRVHLDGIDFKVIPDTNARGVSLRSGEIDASVEPPEPGQLRSDPNLDVTTITGAGWKGLFVNVGNVNGVGTPPGKRDNSLANSEEARRALSLAMDRGTLIRFSGGDGSQPACSAIPPKSEFYDDPPCQEQADPEAAKALIKKAGIQTPIEATFLVAGVPEETRLAQAVQAMAREAGIELKIETCDVASCQKRLVDGDYDVAQGGFDGVVDPDQSLSPFVASTGGFNIVGESDPELDRLLQQARAESLDDEKRAVLYKQALELIRERSVMIFFYNTGSSFAARKNVGGYVLTPSNLVYYTTAGFTEGS